MPIRNTNISLLRSVQNHIWSSSHSSQWPHTVLLDSEV